MSNASTGSPQYVVYSKTYSKLTANPTTLPRQGINVEGKTIVITEGARSVGFLISQAFARAGATHIIITGTTYQDLVNAKALINAEMPLTEIHPYVWDNVQETIINRIFADVRIKYGPICVVVHCLPSSAPSQTGTSDFNTAYLSGMVQASSRNTTTVAQAFRQTATALDPVLIDVSTTSIRLAQYPGFAAYIAGEAATLPSSGTSAVSSSSSSSGISDIRIVTLHPGLENPQASGDIDQLGSTFVVWLGSAEPGSMKNKFVWASWDGDKVKVQRMEDKNADPLPLRLNGWE